MSEKSWLGKEGQIHLNKLYTCVNCQIISLKMFKSLFSRYTNYQCRPHEVAPLGASSALWHHRLLGSCKSDLTGDASASLGILQQI